MAAMSSTSLAVLGFALSSWLDGSAQLRCTLLSTTNNISRRNDADLPRRSSRSPNPTLPFNAEAHADEMSFKMRILRWFGKPERDMDDVEKTAMGFLDVSTSFILLKLLGSGPLLPLLLNPLAVVLPLPRRFSVDNVRWPNVALISLALCVLRETARASVAVVVDKCVTGNGGAGGLGLGFGLDVGDVVARGDDIHVSPNGPRSSLDGEMDADEPDECLICSGVGFDPSPGSATHDSTGAYGAATPVGTTISPGPLEAFCVNAPQKHPMHRACFLAWGNAYRDQRPRQNALVLRRLGEGDVDAGDMIAGEHEWARADAIMRAAGLTLTEDMLRVPSAEDIWIIDARGALRRVDVDVSVFSLQTSASGRDADPDAVLGTLMTNSPPCPGCRSAVKLWFKRTTRRGADADRGSGTSPVVRVVRGWLHAWRQLVTGRTVLAKWATQLILIAALASMMKARRVGGGRGWMRRG